jgi:tyrosine-protein phosphatase YwqE
MIDLHCHLLDGTGCGPADFTESLEMCRQAIADDVTTLVATPTWRAGSEVPPITFEDYDQKLDQLQTATAGQLAIRPGFLLQYSAQLPDLVRTYGSKLALGNGSSLLVALPPMIGLSSAEPALTTIMNLGFGIVLARPECSPVIRRSPDLLFRWMAEGQAIQLDASSIIGGHGRDIQNFALRCVRTYSGQVAVATNNRSARVGANQITPAYELLKKKLDARKADSAVAELPAHLLKRRGMVASATGARAMIDSPGRILTTWRSIRAARTLTSLF